MIPEPVSLYLLSRLKSKRLNRVFEPFSGIGGIAIHLADSFDEYVVNDIDVNKLKMLRHNLKVYGKSGHSLKILNQDFLEV